MKKLKIIIIILLLLIICLLAKNTQYHSQIIEKDNQIEKLKQENLKYQYQIEEMNEQWGVYSK
jgi:peptidoglycan hydrolase CwlO-like protein|nr:MAG TPA: cell division protein [Caudoviricetes sp.]